MLNLDCTILSAVVDQAMRDAAGHPRWLNAISRATVEVLSNPYVARQDGHLLVASPTSGNIYAANGQCQCEAFKFNRPCWHRAAARLVRLHDERQAAQQQAAELADRVIAVVEQCAETPAERYARACREIDECYA